MFGDLLSEVMGLIEKWKPGKYPKEPGYRDELVDFLREQLNEKPDQLGFAKQRLSINKEDSRGYCDIGVDRKVGIELKKDLKGKSKIDRLAGQIMDYKKEYKDIIVVLVGDTDKDALEALKDKIAQLSQGGGLYQEPRIKIINKGTGAKTQEKPKSPWDIGI